MRAARHITSTQHSKQPKTGEYASTAWLHEAHGAHQFSLEAHCVLVPCLMNKEEKVNHARSAVRPCLRRTREGQQKESVRRMKTETFDTYHIAQFGEAHQIKYSSSYHWRIEENMGVK